MGPVASLAYVRSICQYLVLVPEKDAEGKATGRVGWSISEVHYDSLRKYGHGHGGNGVLEADEGSAKLRAALATSRLSLRALPVSESGVVIAAKPDDPGAARLTDLAMGATRAPIRWLTPAETETAWRRATETERAVLGRDQPGLTDVAYYVETLLYEGL
jgi:hypothetical protein